jgi:uncharacterized protein (DUF1810 family)
MVDPGRSIRVSVPWAAIAKDPLYGMFGPTDGMSAGLRRALPTRVRVVAAARQLPRGPRYDRAVTADLERFIEAQRDVYPGVLDELRSGRKTSHWIWFIFPQLAGLGRSATSQAFAIRSIEEARAYLAHPVLGARVRECATIVAALEGRRAMDIFGPLDAMKVRSSMTLFLRAAPDEPVFALVLDRFYDGLPDDATDAMLRGDPPVT